MKKEQKCFQINNYSIMLGGLSHIGDDKSKNQDAFRIGGDQDKELAYMIVADGLGSCKFSDQGAEKITSIIENWILNRLPKYAFLSDNVVNIMIKRIVEEWQSAYDFETICDYDTTVHMAVFYKGALLIGGIGDGMALIRCDDLICKDQINEKNLFSNVTNSMCSINILELMDFEIIPTEMFQKAAIMILSTDGIADDLIPEKKLTLPRYFQEVLTEKGIDALQDELEEWIADWETDGHSDDKTLCYLAIEEGITS